MLSPDLLARLGELSDLGANAALLGWDQQTMMPPGGTEGRAQVLATLARIGHERQTDPHLGELLHAAEPEDDRERAIVRVALRDHERALRVPRELAAEMELAAVRAQGPWLEARERADFARFAPFLAENLRLRRELAACFPEAAHPYDALMDAFEPGLTTEVVRDVFRALRDGLVPLVREIGAARAAPPLPGPFPVRAQKELSLEIARSMGFEDGSWRLDLAVHPFAQALNPHDVRVTARYDTRDLQGLFAVMHEVGHGLYEHQVAGDLARTTLGTGVSLGIHESQSRLWENWVGRSEAFWHHWSPRARELFGPGSLGDLDDHDLLRAINAVQPALIRVDADEVTYSLHVILRFELELALVEGTLAVEDLPAAWNAKTRDLLGIEVPDDTRGRPAGHPLGLGRVRLLPDVRHRQRRRRPAVAGGVRRARGPGGGPGPGRHVRAAGVAARGGPPARQDARADGAPGPRHGPGARPQPVLEHLWGKYGALYGLDRRAP
jgi:carboxypeptidase Taq